MGPSFFVLTDFKIFFAVMSHLHCM